MHKNQILSLQNPLQIESLRLQKRRQLDSIFISVVVLDGEDLDVDFVPRNRLQDHQFGSLDVQTEVVNRGVAWEVFKMNF